MKICMISKYPPIQGGISAKTYWLAQGLAEREIETHVVTNANCVEKEYRIDDPSPEPLPNLHVHFVDPDIPWHIPYSELYLPRLLEKLLQITRENQIDLVDAGYLIPYGIVGYLLSKITGIPYVLRHGGSDLEKFFRKGVLGDLLAEVIANASAIITDEKNVETFRDLNSQLCTVPRYIPDERYFKPSISPHDAPTLAYIGKINYHWRHKGLHKIAEVFARIKGDFRLLFVGQGKGFKDFSDFISGYGLRDCEFHQFVHPANIPRLLNKLDFLLYFVGDNPIGDFSNILCEALWSGVRVLTDDTTGLGLYTEYIQLVYKAQIVNVPINDIEATRDKINKMIEDWERPQHYANKIKYDFNTYLDANLDVYSEI